MTIISLGWNCDPAIMCTQMKLKLTKEKGYLTCPFDLMVTNYKGICECIRDKFKYLTDINYLVIDNNAIYHTKYKFIFNHESPNHFDILKHENWSSPNHFVDNNFEKFIDRYNKRIANFNKYISENYVIFVHQRYNSISPELDNAIHETYPQLKYRILCVTKSETEHGKPEFEKIFVDKYDPIEMERFESTEKLKNVEGNCINVVNYKNITHNFINIVRNKL